METNGLKINILKLTFAVESALNNNDAKKVRGYLGNLFWNNSYAHQHSRLGEDGKLIYRYPCAQYKVIDGLCMLIGFQEGAGVTKKIFYDLKEIKIDGKWLDVSSKGLESYTAVYSISAKPITYTFLTPWLALNEKNYEKYQLIGLWEKRKSLLENILVGNIMSMSRGIGYTVPGQIEANIHNVKEVNTSLKGAPTIGFLGAFSVNFEIPDYFGIGKSVSRGFGTVVRVSLAA